MDSKNRIVPAGPWSEGCSQFNMEDALDRSGSIPHALHDSEVKCLLHADDLLLLSITAEGLRQSLALLEQYCKEWALTGNQDKTRVVVFQKKENKYKFTYGGEVLEHCTRHLQCIEISASGDFSLAVKALNEKDRRAFYAIKSVWPIKT